MKTGDTGGILLVAATARELGAQGGLACGIGPVEAAAATARALALERPAALLHVGLAGAHGLQPVQLAIGAESVYRDLSAAIPLVTTVRPAPELLHAAHRALPGVPAVPIETSAAVTAGPGDTVSQGPRVEAMEGFGVLRAAELAGVPAVEVRAISNALGEQDRTRWRMDEALAALAEAVPPLLDEIARALAAP